MFVQFGVAIPRGRHSQHRPYIFQQNSIAHIYSSQTVSPVYTPAGQHHMFVYAPCEWRPLGVVAHHRLFHVTVKGLRTA